jgi:hypothetical protein
MRSSTVSTLRKRLAAGCAQGVSLGKGTIRIGSGGLAVSAPALWGDSQEFAAGFAELAGFPSGILPPERPHAATLAAPVLPERILLATRGRQHRAGGAGGCQAPAE